MRKKRGNEKRFWIFLLIILLITLLFYIFIDPQGSPRGIVCADSDGGINPFNGSGITLNYGGGNVVVLNDTCVNSTMLTEYYCTANGGREINISCPNRTISTEECTAESCPVWGCVNSTYGGYCRIINLTIVFGSS